MPIYSTYRKQVKLGPGQVVAFAPGKGYYAKGGSSRLPANPLSPLTRDQMQRLLDSQVAGVINPQKAEIENQRQRTINLANALAELNKDVAPATNAAYQGAAATLGSLAGGFTGAARDAAASDAAAAAETLRRAGAPEAQIQQVQNVGQGAENATYAMGGAIPGGALAREGAAAAAAAALLPATARGVGQYATFDLDRQERELMSQVPQIRGQFQNQLIEQELAKAESALKNRAQGLYEAQYGLDIVKEKNKVAHNRATEAAAARRARISEQNYRLALKKNQQAVAAAEAEGRRPNSALSKGLGFLVDQDGQPILRNGKRIPFKTGSSSGKNGGLTPYQQSQIRASSIETARELRGDPLESDGLPGQGKYIAADGAKGVIVINGTRTTNDPKKAKRDGEYSFAEAQAQLVAAYGISRTKARAYLIAAGWPPPKKAKPKPNSTRIQ